MRDRDIEPDDPTYECNECGAVMTEREAETTEWTSDDGEAIFCSEECLHRWEDEREIAAEHYARGEVWTHSCGNPFCTWGCGEAWVPLTEVKIDGETWDEFAERLFESELCSECHGDVDDHEPVIFNGHWFARCLNPPSEEDT